MTQPAGEWTRSPEERRAESSASLGFFSSFSQSNARDPTRSVQIARAWKHLESQPEAAKKLKQANKKTRLKKQPEIPVRHAGQSSEPNIQSQNTPKCSIEAHPQKVKFKPIKRPNHQRAKLTKPQHRPLKSQKQWKHRFKETPMAAE